MIPIEEAKQKLLAAMAAARAKGWAIAPGNTISSNQTCCPLGAFYVAEGG